MTRVRCEHCGTTFEMPMSPEAVRLVPRCDNCGRRALVAVADAPAPNEDAGPPDPEGPAAADAGPGA